MSKTEEEKDFDRTTYRSELAHVISKELEGNVQVLSREAVSSFGISEWKLIEELEENKNITIGIGRDYSVAKKLQSLSMVDVEKLNEESYRVSRNFEHVVMPVFER